ncbi:MAG: phosphoadenosine phosphosulfate reductase [Roseovarius sp.]
MQDTQGTFDVELGGLGWEAWRAALEDVPGEDGFAEPLGPRHAAVLIERKPVLLVTFESFHQVTQLSTEARPMGWQMVQALGWSHLALVSGGDTWFRDRHVIGFFDRLIDDGFFEDFEQVIFYGAGPSGYAAAAFSVSAPGAKVLALQPQATLDPRIAEWDDRFRHMRRTDFTSRFGYAPDMLDAADETFVIYDPEVELDAIHAALFARSNVKLIRARYLGAQLDVSLMRMQVLYRMLAQISSGRFTDRNIATLLRQRREDAAYQFNLLRHLEARERHGLVALLARAVLERRQARPFRKALNQANEALEKQAAAQAEASGAAGEDDARQA